MPQPALLGITGAAVAADSAANMQQPKQTREFKRGELPRDLQALNLSAAQKTRIQAIMQEGRPAQTELSEAQRNQMRRASPSASGCRAKPDGQQNV